MVCICLNYLIFLSTNVGILADISHIFKHFHFFETQNLKEFAISQKTQNSYFLQIG